jgi:hypothetical protein
LDFVVVLIKTHHTKIYQSMGEWNSLISKFAKINLIIGNIVVQFYSNKIDFLGVSRSLVGNLKFYLIV